MLIALAASSSREDIDKFYEKATKNGKNYPIAWSRTDNDDGTSVITGDFMKDRFSRKRAKMLCKSTELDHIEISAEDDNECTYIKIDHGRVVCDETSRWFVIDPKYHEDWQDYDFNDIEKNHAFFEEVVRPEIVRTGDINLARINSTNFLKCYDPKSDTFLISTVHHPKLISNQNCKFVMELDYMQDLLRISRYGTTMTQIRKGDVLVTDISFKGNNSWLFEDEEDLENIPSLESEIEFHLTEDATTVRHNYSLSWSYTVNDDLFNNNEPFTSCDPSLITMRLDEVLDEIFKDYYIRY